MLRVFFDTSVLYPAVHSPTGAARELFRLALEKRLRLVVSEDVLTEAYCNIAENIPAYEAFLTALDPEVLPFPPIQLVREVEQYIAPKDAPIVAAAIQAKPDYVVSFDKRHILNPEVAHHSGLRIVRPEIVVHTLRSEIHSIRKVA